MKLIHSYEGGMIFDDWKTIIRNENSLCGVVNLVGVFYVNISLYHVNIFSKIQGEIVKL